MGAVYTSDGISITVVLDESILSYNFLLDSRIVFYLAAISSSDKIGVSCSGKSVCIVFNKSGSIN